MCVYLLEACSPVKYRQGDAPACGHTALSAQKPATDGGATNSGAARALRALRTRARLRVAYTRVSRPP